MKKLDLNMSSTHITAIELGHFSSKALDVLDYRLPHQCHDLHSPFLPPPLTTSKQFAIALQTKADLYPLEVQEDLQE